MTDEIILLGTKGGPAIRQNGAMPTASLLKLNGKTILIDCAVGSTRSTVDAGVSLLDIDAIFITHLHSDHVLELGPLLYTAWTTGLRKSVDIYGPDGISAYWDGFMASMSYDYEIRLIDEGRPPLKDMINVHSFSEGAVANMDGMSIDALRVQHPPVTDCFALRFTANNKTVTFSADTSYFPALADFAAGSDVLIHEAMLLDGVERLIERTPGADRLREHLLASHTFAQDAGKIATQGKVGHLVLNHLVPADDPDFGETEWTNAVRETWDGPLTIGHDGLKVPL